MPALDGTEQVEVLKDGHRIFVPVSAFTNRIFRIITDDSTSRKARYSDQGCRIVMTSGSACSVVIPLDSDGGSFDDGGAFEIEQGGAGAVTIVPAAGVTINTAETLVTAKQFAVLYLVREGANQWHCSGYQVAA